MNGSSSNSGRSMSRATSSVADGGGQPLRGAGELRDDRRARDPSAAIDARALHGRVGRTRVRLVADEPDVPRPDVLVGVVGRAF